MHVGYKQTFETHIPKYKLYFMCPYSYLHTLYFYSVCMYIILTISCSGSYCGVTGLPCLRTKEKAPGHLVTNSLPWIFLRVIYSW